jgi:GDP-L-fucose synthase
MELLPMEMSKERIVITGGAGFLGRNLVKYLLSAGISRDHLLIPTIEKFDLTCESDVIKMYHEYSPSVVIHLAAIVGGIGANREHPGLFFYRNLIMGAMLMEHARINRVKKFVAIGTICAYPKLTPVPFSEDRLWDGYPEETNAPYGLAKKMLLVQAQAYRQEYGFNAIYLLPVNLYGPGDNFDPASSHVIPALIRKCLDAIHRGATHIDVWGSGNATREFLFVEDAARGIALAADRYNGMDPVNLGSGREITIRALVKMICEITGFDGEIRWDITRPDGQPRRCLDTSRAERYFGFRAEKKLRDGLKETIEWYKGTLCPAAS